MSSGHLQWSILPRQKVAVLTGMAMCTVKGGVALKSVIPDEASHFMKAPFF